jgi:hypothetical protein
MKKLLMGLCLLWLAQATVTGQVAAWDFYGQSFPVSCTATLFDTALVSASGANLITRGPGAPASGGVHSFRTTGFQNNGIATSNFDYFQVTLTAKPGYKLSLASLDARFNGTSTFFAAPGVTSQFAYSLDGSSFTLIGNPVQSTALTMAQVNLSSVAALQNVYASVTVTIRYYASGQTTTGGWGFYSATAGTFGFAIGGSITPVTILPPSIQASNITTVNSGVDQLSLSWTNGNGDKRIVLMNTTNNFTAPVNGTAPPANSVYTGSGEQVVFNGAGNGITVTGLLPGTGYWFRVYEYNGAGILTQYNTAIASGNPGQAATSGQLLPPVVLNPVVSNIGITTANLGATVTHDGGSAVTERGTVWSLQSPVTTGDHPLAFIAAGTGAFSHQRTGLPPASLIHYAGYAINISGTGLSAEGSFYTLALEPASHVSGFVAANAGITTIDLTWSPTIYQPGGYLILMKEGTMPSAASPADAMEYTPGNIIGDARVAAVLPDSAANGTTISGLTPGTPFTFTIFPFHWDGGHSETINYKTAPLPPSASDTTALPPIISYHWNGSSGTSWTMATNWTPLRTLPAPNDILIFDPGGTVAVTGVPTQQIGQMVVSATTTVTFQGSGTLNFSGHEGADFVVESGSSLTMSGAGAIVLSLSSGTSGQIDGSVTFAGGGHRLMATDSAALMFSAGSVFKAATGFSGNPFGTVNLNSVVFDSGSVYVALAGGNPFGAAAPASVVIFRTGSLYRIDAYHVPSFGGRKYGNFEMNYPGMVTATGTTAVSIDHFIASKGSFYFNVTGDPGHSIKGDIYVSGLATLFFSPSSSGTVHLNGPAGQTIYGTGSIISGSLSRIMADNPLGIVCQMDTELNDLTLNAGATFEVGSSVTLTVEGNLEK